MDGSMNEDKIKSYFHVDGNQHRPTVELNAETGILIFDGRSILENTIRFYEPIVDWVDNYLKNPAPKTELRMRLEYFNTSSSKYFLNIIDNVARSFKAGHDAEVIWYHSDEDMLELGEDYSQMMEVPFTFIDDEE